MQIISMASVKFIRNQKGANYCQGSFPFPFLISSFKRLHAISLYKQAFEEEKGHWRHFNKIPYDPLNFVVYLFEWTSSIGSKVVFYLPHVRRQLTITVPDPIKDVASFKNYFFLTCKIVYFTIICLYLLFGKAQKFNKTNLSLVIFWLQLLLKSVLYWRGYGNIFCRLHLRRMFQEKVYLIGQNYLWLNVCFSG